MTEPTSWIRNNQRTARPSQSSRKLSRKKKKRHEPFYRLFSRVGLYVFIVFATIYYIFIAGTLTDIRETHQLEIKNTRQPNQDYPSLWSDRPVSNTLQGIDGITGKGSAAGPLHSSFALHEFSNQPDAFSIVQEYDRSGKVTSELSKFVEYAARFRNDFVNQYAGEEKESIARALLHKSLEIIGQKDQSPDETMKEFATFLRNKHSLHMIVVGSSSAAGYGNMADDAYPHVLQGILEEMMSVDKAIPKMVVNNLARDSGDIGPMLWCSDVRNADIAMYDFQPNPNDQHYKGNPQGLEGFIRYIVDATTQPVVLFVRGPITDDERDILQSYVNDGYLQSSIVVDIEESTKEFLKFPEAQRPDGYNGWREYSSPLHFGKRRPNLPKQQHTFMASVIGMYFLAGFASVLLMPPSLSERQQQTSTRQTKPDHLGRPIAWNNNQTTAEASFLLGLPSNNDETQWHIPAMQCQTTYKPLTVMSNRKELEKAVVSGTIGEDLEMTKPRGSMHYTQGWVYDIQASRRKEHQQMIGSGNLGFLDWNVAYRGVPTSGILSLRLESGETTKNGGTDESRQLRMMVCGEEPSVESSSSDGCLLHRDVSFSIGGTQVSTQPVYFDTRGSLHTTSSTCVLLEVDGERRQLRKANKQATPRAINLSARVVNPRISWKKGPCSISHVVWQQQ